MLSLFTFPIHIDKRNVAILGHAGNVVCQKESNHNMLQIMERDIIEDHC